MQKVNLHKILHILVGSNPFFDKIQKKSKFFKNIQKSIIFMLFDTKKLQKKQKKFHFFDFFVYFSVFPT